MSTDIVSARPMSVPMGREVEGLERIATNLANAGIYRKTAKTAQEVFAILLAARDMGVAPTSALAGGIHMVEGKPEVSANLQAQLLREYRGPEGQRYDFRILTSARERSKECHIEFRRYAPGEMRWEQGEVVGEEFFDLADAKRAGLDGKDNYRKYPKMMLLARCLSDGIASHCPETARGLRVYGESEIGGPGPTPPQEEAPAPAPVPTEQQESIVDAVVVEERGEAALLALAKNVLERGLLTKEDLLAGLVECGATDTSGASAALHSLPDEDALAKVGAFLADAMTEEPS